MIADLRAAGRRLTPQREAVLAVLAEEYPRHVDAAEIFEQARERVPRLNLASVYRTLKVLKQLDLVDELAVEDGGGRYGLRRADDEYHLMCSQCDQVIAVSSELSQQLAQLRRELGRALPFVIDEVEVNLIGHCDGGECRWPSTEL
jgi:Fur family ferric uptake transcriptional regulator